jgi:hypothetical protein
MARVVAWKHANPKPWRRRENSGSEAVVLAIKAACVVMRQFDSVSAWDGTDEGSGVHS